MPAHPIWEHEIKSILDAADRLFSGNCEPRSQYQTIYYILQDVKERLPYENTL
jgi:hypothetical protein